MARPSIHSISYCKCHLPIPPTTTGWVDWAWGEVTTPPCTCQRIFSIIFIQVQSPRFKPNTIPNNNFARILQQAASLCNWKFWLPTYCRSSSIPFTASCLPTKDASTFPNDGTLILVMLPFVTSSKSCDGKAAAESTSKPQGIPEKRQGFLGFSQLGALFWGEVLYLQIHGDENRKPTSQLSWQEPTPQL